MPSPPYHALVILGATATGKTRLGVDLARRLGGEILSADSRQVYRGLDLGTGKDLEEYGQGGATVPYHLIDLVEPGEEYNLFRFRQDCHLACRDVWARGRIPVVVGGTGLYLAALLHGYEVVAVERNEELRCRLAGLDQAALVSRLLATGHRPHNTTDLEDRERTLRALEIALHRDGHAPSLPALARPLVLGTRWPRATLLERIRQRLRERLDAGLVEEVEGLHRAGVPWTRMEQLGLEYREVARFLQGQTRNRNDLFQKLAAAIGRFAKKQESWWRRLEREGVAITWLDPSDGARARAAVEGVRFVPPQA
jgi:tRNA dimethylallyltransferase